VFVAELFGIFYVCHAHLMGSLLLPFCVQYNTMRNINIDAINSATLQWKQRSTSYVRLALKWHVVFWQRVSFLVEFRYRYLRLKFFFFNFRSDKFKYSLVSNVFIIENNDVCYVCILLYRCTCLLQFVYTLTFNSLLLMTMLGHKLAIRIVCINILLIHDFLSHSRFSARYVIATK